ncbi:hypothetical protein [Selenomonas felix]|uniref:hypothetical protein n=1 Tax=Selenomonas felix TaxID=1944634 RepID=UPI0023549435|nr:hypothetical protein [Selenomonas felix]
MSYDSLLVALLLFVFVLLCFNIYYTRQLNKTREALNKAQAALNKVQELLMAYAEFGEKVRQYICKEKEREGGQK